MGRSRFRKGRVLNSNWKDIIHFDSVIAPSSSMALEDITDVIKNLEWIRSFRNKVKINISNKRVQKH
jgi:hypothetical protein